jgi:GT2 family glycosyltransferase
MNSVSVIVITFNSSSTTKDCLVSLGEQTPKDFEVILVDNKDQRVMMTPVFEREFLRNKLRKFVLG